MTAPARALVYVGRIGPRFRKAPVDAIACAITTLRLVADGVMPDLARESARHALDRLGVIDSEASAEGAARTFLDGAGIRL